VTTKLAGGGATDVGRVRKLNEDRFLVADGLFAVADGVGGHQAGEVASQTSIDTLAESFTEPTTDGLVTAVKDANAAVWSLAQDNPEQRGMGTTITAAALVVDDGEEHLAIANVGDSRAYLMQNGDLLQVSEDHSVVAELVRQGQITPDEAKVHEQRAIITRALGMEPEIEVDYWQIVPYRGDRLLLCSDGLTNEVPDDRIASTLRRIADPQEAARDLVRQALANGGKDNVSVVVVDVVDDGGRSEDASAALKPERGEKRGRKATAASAAADHNAGSTDSAGSPSARGGSAPAATATAVATTTEARREEPELPSERPRRLTWRVGAFFLALIAVVAVGLFAVGWYARGTYYVGLRDDHVAIFKGRPGGFLWFKPTLQEQKSLTVNDILPVRVDDLRAGKEESSKAEADRYVNRIRQEGAEAGRGTPPTTVPVPTTAPSPAQPPTPPAPPPPA
jgi:protein phosphatase